MPFLDYFLYLEYVFSESVSVPCMFLVSSLSVPCQFRVHYESVLCLFHVRSMFVSCSVSIPCSYLFHVSSVSVPFPFRVRSLSVSCLFHVYFLFCLHSMLPRADKWLNMFWFANNSEYNTFFYVISAVGDAIELFAFVCSKYPCHWQFVEWIFWLTVLINCTPAHVNPHCLNYKKIAHPDGGPQTLCRTRRVS